MVKPHLMITNVDVDGIVVIEYVADIAHRSKYASLLVGDSTPLLEAVFLNLWRWTKKQERTTRLSPSLSLKKKRLAGTIET